MANLAEYEATKVMTVEEIITSLKAGGVTHLNLVRQFGDTKLEDEELVQILSSIPKNTLKTLELALNNLGNDSCKALASVLESSKLETLDLSDTDFDEQGALLLAEAIANNPTLKTLNLQNTNIGNSAVVKIVSALPRVENLNVGGEDNGISSDGLKAISGLLGHSNLTSLVLDWSKDTDTEIIRKFFLVLRDNVNLHTLECWRSYAPVEFLEEAFEKNRTIIHGSGGMRMPYLTRFIKINKTAVECQATEDEILGIPQGLDTKSSILSFFEQYRKSSEPWNAIKLVLLGHGEIGKSTLLQTIKKEAQVQREPKSWYEWTKEYFFPSRTVGVEQDNMKIGEGEVSVWDFGGQLEYTVTHQFFLSSEMVVYIVCFDSSASLEEQEKQIAYWMNFLYSSLPHSKNNTSNSKWRIILVGLKKDLASPESLAMPAVSTDNWKGIPIFDRQFLVSSHKNDNIKELLKVIEDECNRIFKQHTSKIPTSYKSLLQALKTIPEDKAVTTKEQLFNIFPCGMKKGQFSVALQYLHAIGHVVLLANGLVCTVPTIIPKLAAKFISPLHVRRKLNSSQYSISVPTLEKEKIKMVLETNEEDKLVDELKLLEHCGVCFKLVETEGEPQTYLFPSLAPKSDNIQFGDIDSSYYFRGLRFTLKKSIFVPGFFCQLVVALLGKFNTSEKDVRMYSTGVVLSCQGLFLGELIVKISSDSRSVEFIMMATNPNVEIATRVFMQLIYTNFKQYASCEEEILCPTCLREHYEGKIKEERIGNLASKTDDLQLCNRRHQIRDYGRPRDNIGLAEKCRTHLRSEHDFFINYRVATEGARYNSSVIEPAGGLVQVFYETLAPQQKKDGNKVFTFWDKECLNYAQNWQDGFIHGLRNAKVILLLMSEKVFEIMAKNATDGRQDNVLVEYECALLRNMTNKVPVLPILVGQHNQDQKLTKFSMLNAKNKMPKVAHARNASVQRVIDELKKSVAPEKTTFLNSVAETIAELFMLQAINLTNRAEDVSDLRNVITIAMDCLER